MKLPLPKTIFTMTLSIMKKVLDLGEYKLDEKSFKYYKKQVMDIVFNALKQLFQQLETAKIVKRCSCKSKLRQGYNDCPKCAGSGYCDIDEK